MAMKLRRKPASATANSKANPARGPQQRNQMEAPPKAGTEPRCDRIISHLPTVAMRPRLLLVGVCFAFHWPQTGRLACPGARAWTRGAGESASTAERAVVAWRTVHSAAGARMLMQTGSASQLPFWYERQAIAVAKGGGSRGLAPCRGAAVRGGSDRLAGSGRAYGGRVVVRRLYPPYRKCITSLGRRPAVRIFGQHGRSVTHWSHSHRSARSFARAARFLGQ